MPLEDLLGVDRRLFEFVDVLETARNRLNDLRAAKLPSDEIRQRVLELARVLDGMDEYRTALARASSLCAIAAMPNPKPNRDGEPGRSN